MDFRLTDRQESLIAGTSQFFQRYRDDCHKWEEKPQPETFFKVSKELAEHGYMGLCLDQGVGGADLPLFDACLMIQAMAKQDPNSAYIARNSTAGPTSFIAKLGTEAQRQKYAVPVVRGEACTAICITEPDAGTDAGAIRTVARKVDGGYLLNGHKHLITHAHIASAFVVYTRFVGGGAEEGVGALILEPGMAGFTIGKGTAHMGGGKVFELWFEELFVPDANLLIPGNQEKAGFKRLMGVYNIERLSGQFRWLGMAERALEMARDYALNRVQFGKPIYKFQAIQFKLADMALKLESARLLLYRAAVNATNGFPSRQEVSLAKLAMQEALLFVLHEAMQIHGGIGYTKDLPLEYFYRLARLGSIAGGTVEVHRTIVAGSLLGQKLDPRE